MSLPHPPPPPSSRHIKLWTISVMYIIIAELRYFNKKTELNKLSTSWEKKMKPKKVYEIVSLKWSHFKFNHLKIIKNYLSTLNWPLKIVIFLSLKMSKIKKCTFRAHKILKSKYSTGFLHIFGLWSTFDLCIPPKKCL